MSNQAYQARQLVTSAIASGKLVRPKTCEDCQKKKPVQGHHPDYSKPFDVRWLCALCHSRVHSYMRTGPRTQNKDDVAAKQARILDFIREFKARKNHYPTQAQILDGCNFSSISSVNYHLRALQRYGLVDWEPGLARTLRLVEA